MLNILNEIIKISEDLNINTYVVGGYLRDYLLKKQTTDIDLVVSKDTEIFSKLLAKKIKGKYFVLHKNEQIYRLVVFNNPKVQYIDISLMQGNTIEEDLSKRDFTVNALAVDIHKLDNIKKNIIDVSNGLQDLKKKVLNAVYKDAFTDDPLRMLRAFRLSSQYGFTISKKTLMLIKKHSSEISCVAGERIKNELFSILNNDHSSKYISVMDDIKLLDKIFPIIITMKKSAKKFYYHPNGLFQHCFQTYEALENLFLKINKYFPRTKELLEQHFNETFSENVNRKNLLKFAALFHDCAKPDCAQKMGVKMRFLGHEELGAQKIAKIMKNLKMSNKEIKIVKSIVGQHMRPSSLAKNEIISNKAQMKFFRDIEDNTCDVVFIAMADWHSYKNLKVYPKSVLKRQEKEIENLIFNYYDLKNKKPKVKIIDGNILMKELSLNPGKIIGAILENINNLYEKGRISNIQQALKIAKAQLTVLKKTNRI